MGNKLHFKIINYICFVTKFLQMENKGNKSKVDQLKALKEKDLPKDVKHSIDKKLEYVNKPFSK